MGEKKRRLAALAGKPIASQLQLVEEHFQLGFAAHEQNNLPLALSQYQLARTRLQEAKLEEAAGMLYARILHFLGLAMCQMSAFPAAISLMRQALQIAEKLPRRDADSNAAASANEYVNDCADNANLALFHFNLANALRDAESRQAAGNSKHEYAPHYARAAELMPGDLDLRVSYAQCLYAQEQIQAAILELQNFLALPAERYIQEQRNAYADAVDLLARYQYQLNQLPASRDNFVAALALKPSLRKLRWLDFALPASAPAHAQQRPQDRHSLPAKADAFASEGEKTAWLDALDLHIIDDFLADFAAHRAACLALPFHAQSYFGQNYPGQQTDGQVCPEIMAQIARVLGKPIKFASPDNGSCRISLANASAKSDIHADNESGDSIALYAAVLYLNLPQDCQGGTTFWRHQATGWSRRMDEATVQAQGYTSFKQFQQRQLPHNLGPSDFNALASRRAQWQCLLEVPMRSNRLIIYRGDFFHAIGEVFGSNMEDGRLVQLFFFETLPESV